MKKKILCMILCIMMMLSTVLTSCSINSGNTDVVEGTDDEDGVEEGDRTPVTLTFWIKSDNKISEATVKAVETAMNNYLKSNFTTAVELKIFSEDEYETELMARIQKIKDKEEADAAEKKRLKELAKSARKEGKTLETTTAADTVTTDTETIKNEYGVNELKYPNVGEYQFDIFLITDYNQYLKLIDMDALSELDTSLSGASKVMKSYIYPTFLTAAKFNGGTYCIPNNHGLGEFKYLLLNKEMIDKYDYDPDILGTNVTSLASCEEFIRDIARYEDTNEIAPLLSWTDPVGMTYWSDDGSWNVLASSVPNKATFNTSAAIGSIFKNNAYKSNFKLMKSLEEDGCIAADPETCEKFAVGVVSGNAGDVAKYEEDYYIYTYELPRATQEDVFAGAFAVSSYTKNINRAMEIITALNTDKALRDILQYGVEGVNFRYDENDQVVILNDEYQMNILYAGNAYMASLVEGTDENYWEYDKEKNLNSIYSPFIYCPNLRNEGNEAAYAELKKISKDYYDRMMAASLEDVDTVFSDLNTELQANETFRQMSGADNWEYGVAFIYNNFFTENFAEPEE